MYRKFDNNSKQKRIKMTDEERYINETLKTRAYKDFLFFRHYRIGDYIADFICENPKIIIDIFYGNYNSEEEMLSDEKRLNFFKAEGYNVVRIGSIEILHFAEGIHQRLLSACGLFPTKTGAITIDENSYVYERMLNEYNVKTETYTNVDNAFGYVCDKTL